jgi:hypothetical protein
MKTRANLTPWFPGSVKPARDGVYEISRLLYSSAKRCDVRRYHRLEFRGSLWHYTMNSRMSYPGSLSSFGCFPQDGERWRGLSSPKR